MKQNRRAHSRKFACSPFADAVRSSGQQHHLLVNRFHISPPLTGGSFQRGHRDKTDKPRAGVPEQLVRHRRLEGTASIRVEALPLLLATECHSRY
jgi:hypothetical protein